MTERSYSWCACWTCRPPRGSVVGQPPSALVKQVPGETGLPLGLEAPGAPLGESSQASPQPLSLSPWPWQPDWMLGTSKPSPQPDPPASSLAEAALAGSFLTGETTRPHYLHSRLSLMGAPEQD